VLRDWSKREREGPRAVPEVRCGVEFSMPSKEELESYSERLRGGQGIDRAEAARARAAHYRIRSLVSRALREELVVQHWKLRGYCIAAGVVVTLLVNLALLLITIYG